MQVDVVERRFDLVHHVERRRPAAEHGEQVGQRRQRALATRQQRQLLDVLAARLGLDLDAGVQQVVGVGQHEVARRHPGRACANSCVKCVLTSANAAANTVWISRSTALITRIRSRRVLRTSSSCSSRNLWRCLQLVELLERQRVDRAHQTQLAVEIAHARGRADALGQRRLLGRLGGGRLEIVVAAQTPRRHLPAASAPRLRRSRRDAIARGSRRAPSRPRSRRRRTSSRRWAMPRTSSLCLRRISISSSWRASITPRWPSTSADRLSMAVRACSTSRRRCPACARATASTSSRRSVSCRSPFQELLALVQPGVADLEILALDWPAARRGHRARRGSRRAPWLPRPRPLRRLRAPARGRRARRSGRARGSRRSPASATERVEGLELCLGLATIALRTGQRLGTGREPGVVGVELPAEVAPRDGAASCELDPCQLLGAGPCFELGRGDAQAFLGLFQGRRGGTTAGDADPPARRTESVAVVGDDNGVGIGDGDVDRVRPRRHADRRADDRVEQFGHATLAAAHVRSDRRRRYPVARVVHRGLRRGR